MIMIISIVMMIIIFIRGLNSETPCTAVQPASDVFDLRGSTYLKDKVKISAKDPIFSLVDIKIFSLVHSFP